MRWQIPKRRPEGDPHRAPLCSEEAPLVQCPDSEPHPPYLSATPLRGGQKLRPRSHHDWLRAEGAAACRPLLIFPDEVLTRLYNNLPALLFLSAHYLYLFVPPHQHVCTSLRPTLRLKESFWS